MCMITKTKITGLKYAVQTGRAGEPTQPLKMNLQHFSVPSTYLTCTILCGVTILPKFPSMCCIFNLSMYKDNPHPIINLLFQYKSYLFLEKNFKLANSAFLAASMRTF